MSKLFECIDVSKTFTIDKSPIEALKKKAGKVIREHGENYGAVADVDPKISPLLNK